MRKLMLDLILLLVLTGSVVEAAPNIVNFSSTGGVTTNKNGDQDRMYLIESGDALVFTATADQAVSYEWAINKSTATGRVITAPALSDIFNWTVPDEKGIWEIHLKCWNVLNEETHTEWVVSTLDSLEAPEVFDCFADLKYENRDAADPWGRNLPVWTVESGVMSAGEGSVKPLVLGLGTHANISAPTNILRGTWIFRYKYLNGTPVFSGNDYTLEITAQYNNPPGLGKGYNSVYKGLGLKNPVDGHWWLDYPDAGGHVVRNGYIVNMAGSQIDKNLVGGNSWHEVVFIRDENDYIYSWLDGKFVRWTTDQIYDLPSSSKMFFDFYDGTYALAYPIAIDGVRIYREKYLPPVNSAVYDPVSDSIIIKGFGMTMGKIAEAVNNSSIFDYDPMTNTATSYKNITVSRGSELLVENGKLILVSSSNGERKIKFYTDAIFNIKNSTITSSNNYYYLFQRLSDGDANLKGIFKFVNATIDNSGGIFLERPVVFLVENSRFTNLNGNITVYFRWPPREQKISGSIFEGKTGNERVSFYGGDQFGELSPKVVGMDITNSDFSKVKLECSRDSAYYLSPGTPECTVNIVNTKLTNYLSTTMRVKYYLDIKVVDREGKAVEGAQVTVVNESDNLNYPSENLLQDKKYFQLINQLDSLGLPYFSGQTSNWIKGWADCNNLSETLTGFDGHTPYVTDTAKTLVLTDKEIRDGTTTYFTYLVNAAKDGRTASIAGLDIDETWLTTDPAKPAKTLVMVLGGAPYVTVDSENPVITIVTPQEEEKVFGVVPVEALVSDNKEVSKVEFYLDESLMKVFLNSPYQWLWDTKEATEGRHGIKIAAYDGSGNTANKTINVTVTGVSGVVVYPNPYVKGKSGAEKITFANLPKEATIRIYNVSGELRETIEHKETFEGGKEEWDVRRAKSGLYLYVVTSSERTWRGKVSVIK